jgi:hypothetical protein
VEAESLRLRAEEGEDITMRKIFLALASLAAFAMAVGAGWKPN